MAYMILGQAVIPAETDVDVVTATAQTVISSLIIANRQSAPVKYRVAARKGGDALTDAQYLFYDVTLGGFASDVFTIGITLEAGDVVTVRSDVEGLSVNIFGAEV